MNRFIVALAVPIAGLLMAGPVFAQRAFEDAVKKLEARVDPVSVKRGQTVKWKLYIELADGWHTYPTKQLDPKHDSYVNKIRFANTPEVVFVGDVKEPDLKVKIEDGAKMGEVEGLGVWEKALVIRRDAKPGKVKIPVLVSVQVCDQTACLPPKKITLEVEVTISDAPAVAVDAKYQKEVEAASKK